METTLPIFPMSSLLEDGPSSLLSRRPSLDLLLSLILPPWNFRRKKRKRSPNRRKAPTREPTIPPATAALFITPGPLLLPLAPIVGLTPVADGTTEDANVEVRLGTEMANGEVTLGTAVDEMGIVIGSTVIVVWGSCDFRGAAEEAMDTAGRVFCALG